MTAIRAIVFDWGNTLMRDCVADVGDPTSLPEFRGPMAEWPRVELVPGVAEALERLPRHLVRCVATNAVDSDAELLGLALERGGIRHHFQHLFTARELGAIKPDPRFFHRILGTLRAEPAAGVMVGDSYATDICPAKAAGLRTIWFSEAPPTGPTPCADILIRSMDELPAALATLQAGAAASLD